MNNNEILQNTDSEPLVSDKMAKVRKQRSLSYREIEDISYSPQSQTITTAQ